MKQNILYYLRRLFYIIINALKMLFLYLFKGLTLFFPNKKTKKQKKHITESLEKKENKKEKNNQTTTPPPEEENPIIENTIYNEKNLINDLFTKEEIEQILNNVLKDEFEIDIKKINTDDQNEVNKFKERIFPILTHTIEYKNRKTKDEIERETIQIIKEELWQRPLLITSNKRTKKEYNLFFPNNIIKEQENRSAKEQEEKEEKKEQENKEEKTQTKTPITKKEVLPKKNSSISIIEKKKNEELKEEVAARIASSTLVIATIAKEIIQKKEIELEAGSLTEKTALPKLPTKSMDTKKEIESLKRINSDNAIELEPFETINLDNPTELMTLLNQENLSTEQIIKIEHLIEKKKEEQVKKEEEKRKQSVEPIKQEKEVTIFSIFDKDIETIENNHSIEAKKEDLEEKDYENLEEQINKTLYEIELFCIKKEGKLTKEQIDKINQEKAYLEQLKRKIQKEKKEDIEKDERLFTEHIQKEEKEGLLEKVKELDTENQKDLEEENINEIKDLDKIEKIKSKEIEKRLIKRKIKKAMRVASIVSIATLPFIKNRFFFSFTLNIMVKNQLNYLNSLLTHTTKELKIPDLEKITNGQSALENAINTNYNNIEMLSLLQNQTLKKHPELRGDSEYQYYISHLDNRLSKNYQKLTKKYDNLEKFHKKKKNDKVLIKLNNNHKKKDI